MNEQECLQLKRLIRSRISLLEEVLCSSVALPECNKRQEDDDAENPESTMTPEAELRVVEQTERELSRLKQNLQWLDCRDAGYCVECGRDITYDRLEAEPETRLCVLCAGKTEESQNDFT